MQNIYIGVDIGGTKTAVCIGNRENGVIESRKFDTVYSAGDNINTIISLIKEFVDETESENIRSIGISCGGPLDSKKGVILSPPHLADWKNIPITSILAEKFNVPVFLQNDANACAIAEHIWGNGKGYNNIVFLTFGTGLGAGLILDGKLYEGTNGMAGEIGHVRLSPDGPLCYGKNGCAESFCSGTGVSLVYESICGEHISTKQICELARNGNNNALKAIDISAEKLGETLAIIVDLINPERIIIGSVYTRSEDLYKARVRQILDRESLSINALSCEVVPSLLGENIGNMGALGVAMQAEV